MKLKVKPHERIRSEMILKGYTQEAMCKKIGLSPSAFSLKLNGRRDFTLPECAQIAEALETNLDALFFNINVPKREQKEVI